MLFNTFTTNDIYNFNNRKIDFVQMLIYWLHSPNNYFHPSLSCNSEDLEYYENIFLKHISIFLITAVFVTLI